MSSKGAFLRARRPEQKQQRYQAILDTARELALRDGVGGVSLAGIAAGVDMHKSALLKYFGTREEIFLRIAEAEWREWADAVSADLDAGPGAGVEPVEHLVATLGRSLVDRPLLCQLILHSTLTLERHVSLDAVRSFKIASVRAVDDVADAAHRALPALGRPACVELLMAGGLVAAGLWQATHPPPVVLELYAAQSVPSGVDRYATLDFADGLDRFVRVHLAGLQQIGPLGPDRPA